MCCIITYTVRSRTPAEIAAIVLASRFCVDASNHFEGRLRADHLQRFRIMDGKTGVVLTLWNSETADELELSLAFSSTLWLGLTRNDKGFALAVEVERLLRRELGDALQPDPRVGWFDDVSEPRSDAAA